jgi:hypothetical protein
MKWRGLLLAVSVSALACWLALFIRPGEGSRSPLLLQVLREIRDHGKLVVFFRLEGAGRRRISVTSLKAWSTLGLRVGMQVESDLIVNPRDQP